MSVFVIPRIALQFIFYSPSREELVVYSLIISGLNYIKSVDSSELLKSGVDSGFIIAQWHVPSALLKGVMLWSEITPRFLQYVTSVITEAPLIRDYVPTRCVMSRLFFTRSFSHDIEA
jgi:hypothetical protein